MDGDSFSMIIVFEQCLGLKSTLRDENVINFNKERYRVYRGQESYVCNSVNMKYHKVYCEEIKPFKSWGNVDLWWTLIHKLFWHRCSR